MYNLYNNVYMYINAYKLLWFYRVHIYIYIYRFMQLLNNEKIQANKKNEEVLALKLQLARAKQQLEESVVYTYMHTHFYPYKYTYMHTYLYIHTYIHTYIHIYIRALTHTCIIICYICVCITQKGCK